MNIISTIYDSRFSTIRKYFFQVEIEIFMIYNRTIYIPLIIAKKVFLFFFFKKFFYVEKSKLRKENIDRSKIKDYLRQNFT